MFLHLLAISPGGATVSRAQIVAVAHVKGGVGKTTLAVNLAISQAHRGTDVLLVDGDEQGTARAFTQLRADVLGAPGYTAVSLRGAEIRTQVRLLRTKYDHIIIDVGGRDTASLRAALTIADTVVVPVLPASFDVWSLEPLCDLIREAREINDELSVLAMLNAADAQGRDNDEAAAIIRETADFEYFRILSFGARRSAMPLPPVCRYRSAGPRTRRRSMNLRFSRITFSDTLAPMPDSETDGRFIQTPIRFPKELLERIDWAAKRRGLNRSSWLRYAATRELDREEQ